MGGKGAKCERERRVGSMLPLAHVGHWLWVLYLPPVVIVAGSLIGNRIRDRRRDDRSSD
jgi:hypothetical protein